VVRGDEAAALLAGEHPRRPVGGDDDLLVARTERCAGTSVSPASRTALRLTITARSGPGNRTLSTSSATLDPFSRPANAPAMRARIVSRSGRKSPGRIEVASLVYCATNASASFSAHAW
jgi:hypothetical protein